jgi:hypothetical protein
MEEYVALYCEPETLGRTVVYLLYGVVEIRQVQHRRLVDAAVHEDH